MNKRQASKRSSSSRFIMGATAVLLLAAIMRLLFLQDIPPGLSQDEVLNADIVSFIRGGAHALFFREGYGHEPLYHYWAVPFQVLFGDNILSIRLPAVYLGLLLIALAMRWVKREFGPTAAGITGVGLAISWWPIIFSRVGLRPIMEPFLLLVFAWFWPRRPWLAGLFLGLAVYAYTGARILFLLPVLLFLYWLIASRWYDGPRQKFLRWRLPRPAVSSLIALLVSLLAALPLFLTLRADPTLQQRVQQLEGPLVALSQGNLQPILSTTLATLGVFSFTGDPRWTYTLPDRPLFDPLTALFFYGGLLLSILRFKRPAFAFALIWLFVGIIPSAITPQAPSTVRLVGAMPVIYLLPALALTWLWQRAAKNSESRGRVWQGLLLLLFGLLFVLNMAFTVRDGFIRWPNELETRMRYQTVWQDIARMLELESQEALVIADSFYRPITVDTLRRNMNEPVTARWIQTGSEVAGALVLPEEGSGRLVVPEYAAPDPWLLETAGIDPHPLIRGGQDPSFAVYELPEDFQLPELEQPVDFEGVITLVGYDTSQTPEQGSLQLITIWKMEETLPEDVAIFVHLRDDQGELLSQHDGFDAAPETLKLGDLVLQRHVLPLGEALQVSPNTLHIGLYTRGDGQRFAINDDSSLMSDQIAIPLDSP